MWFFEPNPLRPSRASRLVEGKRFGFSLTELLVAIVIVMALAALTTAAVSAASGNQKKLRTRALIAKLDAIVASQYESYASRNVDAASGTARGAVLRGIARGDLPDRWSVVADLATKATSELTPPQQAYVAIWKSLSDQSKQTVGREQEGAECLFLAVMHGGISDCLDCASLHIDVGDQDGDTMPEFLDAWETPIGFVLDPKKLRLPPDSGKDFFSSSLPFDPVVATTIEAKGGTMRPLIFSAGPDNASGLLPDAGPTPASNEHADNLTNFDEEAKR
jgi:type II secretory pathway pseudopilin PulG